MPIWVGFQAPCNTSEASNATCLTSNNWWIAYDLSCTAADPYTQGTQEADEAVCAANTLGITSSIIYCDMEAYTDPSGHSGACTTKVQDFLNGWVSELHAKGFLAGVYGQDSNVNDFGPSAPNPPDAVWFDAWDNNTSVWDPNFVSNVWPPAQRRILQYCNYPNKAPPTEECTSNPLGLAQFDADTVEAPVLPNQQTSPPSDCTGIGGCGAHGSCTATNVCTCSGGWSGATCQTAPAPTITVTPMATPTSTPTLKPCVGDCGGDGTVTVDEIITMVNIALGNTPVTACDAGDVNDDGQITVDEILAAVNNAMNGCVRSP